MILSQGSGQEGGLTMTGGVTRDPAHCNRLVETVRMTCGLERVKNLPDLANFGQVQDQALGQAWVHSPPHPEQIVLPFWRPSRAIICISITKYMIGHVIKGNTARSRPSTENQRLISARKFPSKRSFLVAIFAI
jgi:hypothetical protein